MGRSGVVCDRPMGGESFWGGTMSENAIANEIERLSEALVLAEPGDLPALADIHTMLQSLGKLAAEAGISGLPEAAAGAADAVESIILDEFENPAIALENVGRVVSAAQQIVRDGRDPGEVVFPREFSTGPSLGRGAESARAGDAEQQSTERLSRGELLAALPAHIDESILGDFLARQPGVLDDIEHLVLGLEKGVDEDKLQELRRLIHTLKGEAGMLGLADVERLCHTAEEALGEGIPSGLTDLLFEIHDWLGRMFAAYSGKGEAPEPCDAILQQLARLTETPAGGCTAEVSEPALPEPKPLEGDPDLLGEFVSEAKEHLDNADVHLLTIETNPKDDEALNAVFRAFHTIKGVSGFLALEQVQSLSHEAENLLDRARKGELVLEGGYIDMTFDSVDLLKRLIDHVADALSSGGPLAVEPEVPVLVSRLQATLSGAPPARAEALDAEPGEKVGELLVKQGAASPGAVEEAVYQQFLEVEPAKLGEILVSLNILSRAQFDEALELQQKRNDGARVGEILLELGALTREDLGEALRHQERPSQKPKVGESLVRSGEVPAKEVAQALRAQQAQRTVEVRETVKVDSDRLDRLIDLIGEMVISESMVSQFVTANLNGTSDVVRHLGQLDKITRELQEMGTSLRMIPVRATFQKMARLARDVAKKANKKIEFVMNGEDTELDKSVVDKIGDPLVHMVRNSVDHGIESDAEERIKAGKPPEGRVELRAFHKGGNIYIEIEDDGRGLDREAILAKGIERGLVREDEPLSDSDIWKLIFKPGFSTAKQVTDVSGRGVGMDVVRRNIESLRGQIEITSRKGEGSVFSIRLPLTLAIIDGMVVRVGKERYILPTLSVVRSIQPKAEDLFTVVNQGEMLSIQGELIPMFRLHELFRIPEAERDPTRGLVAVVEDGGRQAGVLIDELLGQQQIVIKSLGEAMRGIGGISGGAIMPDGLVGLILDVGGLVKLAVSQ